MNEKLWSREQIDQLFKVIDYRAPNEGEFNWEEVSRQVQKSARECEEFQHFIYDLCIKFAESKKEFRLNKKKRIRRKAATISRTYRCLVAGCAKAYGSEGALKHHYRSKHPEMIYKKSVSRDSSPLRDGSPVKRERDFIPTLHIRGRDASPGTARDSLDSPSTGRTSSSSPPSSPAPLTPTTPHHSGGMLRARSHSDSHIPFGDSLLHRMSHHSLQNSAGKIAINTDWGTKSPTSPHPPVAPNAPSGGFFFQTPRSPPQASQPVMNAHPVQQQGPFHVHLPGQSNTVQYANTAPVQVNSPHGTYYSPHHEIVSNELNLNHAPHRTAPHLNNHYASQNAPFIKEEMTVDTHQIVDKMSATVLYDAQGTAPHSHVEDWHKQHAHSQSRVPMNGGYELTNYSTDEMGEEGSAFSPLDDPLMHEDADAGDFIMQHEQGAWDQQHQHTKPSSAFSYHNQTYNQWPNNTNH
eukprot:TRINITY_DN9613_c0_g1_i1.p1 TRINITY_DN9613_c0_g1~~TRINITY_DN9613_c0_g1_i1.p1  ORF type:complete len:465 (-),score=159.24 TRINITY_DN9613_c0_g1_i1:163-1557(-)